MKERGQRPIIVSNMVYYVSRHKTTDTVVGTKLFVERLCNGKFYNEC